MNRVFSSLFVGALSTVLTWPVLADDFIMGKPADADSEAVNCSETEQGCAAKWESSVEFGYVAVTGNQDTESLNGQFSLKYKRKRWQHQGAIAVVTSSSEETVNGTKVTTEAEKYTAQLKSDFKLSKKSYAFGIYDYDKTKDSGFEYQSSLAAGIGYSFLNNDEHSLDVEVGIGSRSSKTEATLILPSETTTENITRFAGQYQWKMTSHSSFEQKLSTEIGEDNTISKSYTAISANLLENLALKFSYSIKDQSDVPVGNAAKETITAFTVVYTF